MYLLKIHKYSTDDPYNNQFSASAACIGIVYDVTGISNPNTNGKDLLYNANVDSIVCIHYRMVRVLAKSQLREPVTAMTLEKCEEAVSKGTLGIESCYYDTDYWAGTVKACRGISNMPTSSQLQTLAKKVW